ncbi:MAG TPA: aminotransferase class IV, partial [Micromonosporaceae bacterium]|nr:aminotransferase class IV [Micromonosporaceae bacterium]
MPERVDAADSPTEIAVPERLVAVLGRGLVPADTPILRADDLGALRGDGIFETLHIRQGRPWMLDEHLRRMSGSAARLDLALPPAKALAELIDVLLAGWPADVEGAARLVCTRGAEAGSDVTVFATVTPIGPAVVRSRREGITVATASLGLAADARERAPWLLGGAKTISYAVNMAAQRWAQGQGVDDVLWVSADGFALEGPTSTLIWLDGTTLCTVPAETTGILAGTTARWLLERADKLGYDAEERMIAPAALAEAAGAWFASSVRGVVEIRAIDGVATAAAKDT